MAIVEIVTFEEIADRLVGAERLGPCLWRDRDGCIYWSVVDILDVFEEENTPANQTKIVWSVIETAEETLRRMGQRSDLAFCIVPTTDDPAPAA